MSRIRLTWNNASTTIVEQRVYRSTAPLDIDDMPEPLAVLPRRDREYLDSTIEDGLVYYYAVSSVLPDYSELISEGIKVEATPGESDPHWDKVVSLLHFDGNLTDETGRNTFYFNGLSSYIGGLFGQGINPDGDYRKRVQSDGQWQFLNGDPVTVELFFKATGSPASNATIFIASNNLNTSHSASRRLALYQMRDNTLALEYGATSDAAIIATSLSYTEFQHLAFTLDSGTLKIFQGGMQVHEGTYPITPVSFVEITLGGMRDTISGDSRQRTVLGVIDELRITKGVARYTENFTPPTKPFPNN